MIITPLIPFLRSYPSELQVLQQIAIFLLKLSLLQFSNEIVITLFALL